MPNLFCKASSMQTMSGSDGGVKEILRPEAAGSVTQGCEMWDEPYG